MKCTGFNIQCDDFELLKVRLVQELNRRRIGGTPEYYQISDQAFGLFFDSYSMRNDSNLMISMIISQIGEDEIKFKIFSGGGKEGLLQISWGVEKRRIHEILDLMIDIINQNNWSFSYVEDNIKKYFEQNS